VVAIGAVEDEVVEGNCEFACCGAGFFDDGEEIACCGVLVAGLHGGFEFVQCIVNSFDSCLQNGILLLVVYLGWSTDDIIQLLDVFLDEIINLTVDGLIPLGVSLLISIIRQLCSTS